MHTDPNCIFCKIAAGTIPSEKVYSDELVVVFKDIQPRSPVHLLIVPREHVPSLSELSPTHDALIAHMMRLLPRLAEQQGLEDGFRTVINTGLAGGQVVFHLHIHLMGGNIRGI